MSRSYLETNGKNLENLGDPDSESPELYNDQLSLYFSDKEANLDLDIQKVENMSPYYTTISINDTAHLLASDYIGPSKYWSQQLTKKSPDDIMDILKQARCLGGHILWPRGFERLESGKNGPTINTARGGGGSFYDRIDWTLIVVKAFYDSYEYFTFENFIVEVENLLDPKERPNLKSQIFRFESMHTALLNSSEWLLKFKTFDKFANFFLLDSTFLDEDYKVKCFAPLFPVKPNSYDSYITENIKAIEERQLNIDAKLESIRLQQCN